MVMLQSGTMPRAKQNDADDDGPEVMIDNIGKLDLATLTRKILKIYFLRMINMYK